MTMRFELAYVWQSLDTPLTSFVARCGLAFHMRAKTAAGTEVQLTHMSRGGQFGRNHRTLVPAPFDSMPFMLDYAAEKLARHLDESFEA